jgi:hypothetical protein
MSHCRQDRRRVKAKRERTSLFSRRAPARASIAPFRSLSSDMSKYQLERPRHLGEVQRIDE